MTDNITDGKNTLTSPYGHIMDIQDELKHNHLLQQIYVCFYLLMLQTAILVLSSSLRMSCLGLSPSM